MKQLALALLVTLPAVAALGDIDKNKTMGNPSAPVVVEVFSDFECPACKRFHDESLPLLMRDYVMTGKVYLVYRDYPLQMHKYSRQAASYAIAAAQFGFYQPVADALFHDQTTWSASGKVWDTVAKVLTSEQQRKVQATADGPGVLNELMTDMNAAAAERVDRTPTIVVSRGEKQYPLPGGGNYTFLKQLIDDLAK